MTHIDTDAAWPDHKPTALLVLADGTVLEGFGLHEGANSEPKEFVVEKAFVGDGI